ncbi:MAG: NTP transferase domain-containing protein [Candidatus Lokiarchaeia archaeon]
MSLLENKLKEKLTIVILCAGEGKRLKKIAKNTPKPLLKIKGLENESILQNTIFKLIKLGIKQITIIIGHLGSTIREFVSTLTKKDLSLQNKLVIINSENQYKFGPLYSLLSITKNKTIYNKNNYYLLIPGDTLFDLNLLKEILYIISKNYESIQKYPFVFYRNIAIERLRETHKKNKVISNAELEMSGSEIVLKRIFPLKIRNIRSEARVNEIIPVFSLTYDLINEILNLKDQIPVNTVWETLNYLISNKKRIIAFNIENKYKFYDIDDKNDLKKLKKKEKDNRCSDYTVVSN